MQKFLLTFIFCLSLTTIFSQTERALQLRKNVVAISSLGEEGFGFISGERKDELFVVTAAHVVENALEENQPIYIKFFDDYKLYKGNIIRNYPEKDIALFVVQKPTTFPGNRTVWERRRMEIMWHLLEERQNGMCPKVRPWVPFTN
jgi:S1-C subfamily serine protease